MNHGKCCINGEYLYYAVFAGEQYISKMPYWAVEFIKRYIEGEVGNYYFKNENDEYVSVGPYETVFLYNIKLNKIMVVTTTHFMRYFETLSPIHCVMKEDCLDYTYYTDTYDLYPEWFDNYRKYYFEPINLSEQIVYVRNKSGDVLEIPYLEFEKFYYPEIPKWMNYKYE